MAEQWQQVATAQVDDGRSNRDLIGAYRRGSLDLRAALTGMSAEELRARPFAGMMSSLEVVCHLADCEQFLADRMKRIIGTDRPLLMGVDATPYLERLRYHDRNLELQLQLVDVTRQQMASDLERLEDAAWERVGIHTETGKVTLRQALLHSVRHLEYHVERIAEKRAALDA